MNEFIKDLLRKNFTFKTIINRCKKQGWDVTEIEINLIKSQLDIELEIERKKKDKDSNVKKAVDIIPLFTEENTYFDFANRLGVNTEYTDTAELIGIVQKLTADIFIKQALCLLRGLELQSEGKLIGLEILFKGYDISLRAVSKAWGIDNLIDLNAAVQCLQAKGYEIK
jgi:hypothetical protein